MKEYKIRIENGIVVSTPFSIKYEEGKLSFSDVFKPVNYIVVGDKLTYSPAIKFSKGNATLTLPKAENMVIIVGGF